MSRHLHFALFLLLAEVLSNCNANRPLPQATDPYVQYSVASFVGPQQRQRQLLVNMRGSPSQISDEDLETLANELFGAYTSQMELECGVGGGESNAAMELLSTEIDDTSFPNLLTKPRTIESSTDISLLLRADMSCAYCQDNDISLFNRDDRELAFDFLRSYAVPFPSHRLPCTPEKAAVTVEFAASVLGNGSNMMMMIPGIEAIYSIEELTECAEEELTDFTFFFTIAFIGDMNVPDLDYQLGLAQQAIITTYNQVNVLNPGTCDPYSRIATNATIELTEVPSQGEGIRFLSTKNAEQQQNYQRRLSRKKYPWSFMNSEVSGKCNGCPSDSCAMDDVSGHSTCAGLRRLADEEGSYCFCVDGANNENITTPTNEEFQMALEEQFEILRNETNFTLVESVEYLIEVELSDVDECCGYPLGGNIPVENDVDLRQSVSDYVIDPELTDYGENINCWDVSRITSSARIFQHQFDFNEPINCWDISRVTDMTNMFFEAYAFNQDVSDWNTWNVVDMESVFSQARAFNQPLANWDTTKVTRMSRAFAGARAFNQDLSAWNTSRVQDMQRLFHNTLEFDQDVSNWDVFNVENFSEMFFEARVFNQDLSGWSVGKVQIMTRMFNSAEEFNQNLCAWSSTATSLDYSMVTDMFLWTSCANKSDPLAGLGPWCYDCQ